MSRRITVTSEEIAEVDLADEVVVEMGKSSLSFNSQKKRFENRQYDDVRDTTVQAAEKLYYRKLKQRNMEKVVAALKRNNYEANIVSEGNTTKIVAVQRVYA